MAELPAGRDPRRCAIEARFRCALHGAAPPMLEGAAGSAMRRDDLQTPERYNARQRASWPSATTARRTCVSPRNAAAGAVRQLDPALAAAEAADWALLRLRPGRSHRASLDGWPALGDHWARAAGAESIEVFRSSALAKEQARGAPGLIAYHAPTSPPGGRAFDIDGVVTKVDALALLARARHLRHPRAALGRGAQIPGAGS